MFILLMEEAQAAQAFNLCGAVLALNDSFATQQMAPLLTRLCSGCLEFMLRSKMLTHFII